MKRIGLCLGCFGMILLLTVGCGSGRSLECSASQEGATQTYHLSFGSDDILKSGTFNYRLTLDEDQQEYFEEIVTEIEKEFDPSEFEGIDVKLTNNGKDVIEVNLGFDAQELSEVLGEELDDSVTYDYIKDDLENSGFVCE